MYDVFCFFLIFLNFYCDFFRKHVFCNVFFVFFNYFFFFIVIYAKTCAFLWRFLIKKYVFLYFFVISLFLLRFLRNSTFFGCPDVTRRGRVLGAHSGTRESHHRLEHSWRRRGPRRRRIDLRQSRTDPTSHALIPRIT